MSPISEFIDAMLAVPREAFVPQNQQAMAYLDLDLDVSEGAGAKRFLIKPAVMAKMLQAAEIKDTDSVLVVGCATGYAAAVVAKLAGQVTATESDPALAAKARETLAADRALATSRSEPRRQPRAMRQTRPTT